MMDAVHSFAVLTPSAREIVGQSVVSEVDPSLASTASI